MIRSTPPVSTQNSTENVAESIYESTKCFYKIGQSGFGGVEREGWICCFLTGLLYKREEFRVIRVMKAEAEQQSARREAMICIGEEAVAAQLLNHERKRCSTPHVLFSGGYSTLRATTTTRRTKVVGVSGVCRPDPTSRGQGFFEGPHTAGVPEKAGGNGMVTSLAQQGGD